MSISPEFNKYPKIANFDEVIFIAQQAYELGFRGGTGKELYAWLKSRLDLTGLSNTAGLPEEFPAPNSQLSATNKGEWTILFPGTYDKVSSGTIEVEEGQFAFAQYDGEDYNLVRVVEPTIDKTDIIQEKSEKVTTEKAIIDYSTPLASERILPDGNSFSEIDRPDLDIEDFALVIVDQDNKVIARIEDQVVTIARDYDRPDLGVVYIDSDGKLLSIDDNQTRDNNLDEDSVKEIIKVSELIPTFWEPPIQEEYNVGTGNQSFWENYDYYSDFDEIRLNQRQAEGYDPYITRELLGQSTVGEEDIYRYEFKPPNPTRKCVIVGTIHGSERIPAMVLLRFFRALAEEWMYSEALTWARHNVHFVVIPCASPYSMKRRTRRVKETEPFRASWSKNGNLATISFDENDFPTTNPNVNASDYFTAADGLEGKTWISLINSSDENVMPNSGYVISRVLNGQTVEIELDDGGNGSGTCDMYVSVDPNRGFDLEGAVWEDYTPSNSLNRPDEQVAVPYNNKGTRPYSLNESKFIKETFDLHNDSTFAIDMHNGASDYDTRYGTGLLIDITPIHLLNDMHYSFTTGEMPIKSSITNVASQYGSRVHSMNAFTIEWGGHNNITEEIATDSQRWMSNFILNGSRFYNKKFNNQ